MDDVKIGLLIKGGRFTKPGKFPCIFKSGTEHRRRVAVVPEHDSCLVLIWVLVYSRNLYSINALIFGLK